MQGASGYDHSLFLDHLGNVWACGSNDVDNWDWVSSRKEQFQRKSTIFLQSFPFLLVIHSVCSLDENGCIWSCGNNGNGQLGLGDKRIKVNQPEQITNLPKIISIICGEYFSLSSIVKDQFGPVDPIIMGN